MALNVQHSTFCRAKVNLEANNKPKTESAFVCLSM
jgi:hypothetical protein